MAIPADYAERVYAGVLGKLVGVSLVALTQYAIWSLLFVGVSLYGAGVLAAAGVAVAKLAGGALVTIEGGGHCPQARHPVKVNLLLRKFVESLGGRRR